MPTTRDFNSLGQWAVDANTTIPAVPVEGVAYRDETVTALNNETGELALTKVNSAEFNQKLYTTTGFTDLADTHGVPGWSDLTDYDVPAIVWGSNGRFYRALGASGPSTAVSDPTTEPTFNKWIDVDYPTNSLGYGQTSADANFKELFPLGGAVPPPQGVWPNGTLIWFKNRVANSGPVIVSIQDNADMQNIDLVDILNNPLPPLAVRNGAGELILYRSSSNRFQLLTQSATTSLAGPVQLNDTIVSTLATSAATANAARLASLKVNATLSANTNGFYRDEDSGFLQVWGQVDVNYSSLSGNINIVFATPFPTAIFQLFVTSTLSLNLPSSNQAVYTAVLFKNLTGAIIYFGANTSPVPGQINFYAVGR